MLDGGSFASIGGAGSANQLATLSREDYYVDRHIDLDRPAGFLFESTQDTPAAFPQFPGNYYQRVGNPAWNREVNVMSSRSSLGQPQSRSSSFVPAQTPLGGYQNTEYQFAKPASDYRQQTRSHSLQPTSNYIDNQRVSFTSNSFFQGQNDSPEIEALKRQLQEKENSLAILKDEITKASLIRDSIQQKEQQLSIRETASRNQLLTQEQSLNNLLQQVRAQKRDYEELLNSLRNLQRQKDFDSRNSLEMRKSLEGKISLLEQKLNDVQSKISAAPVSYSQNLSSTRRVFPGQSNYDEYGDGYQRNLTAQPAQTTYYSNPVKTSFGYPTQSSNIIRTSTPPEIENFFSTPVIIPKTTFVAQETRSYSPYAKYTSTLAYHSPSAGQNNYGYQTPSYESTIVKASTPKTSYTTTSYQSSSGYFAPSAPLQKSSSWVRATSAPLRLPFSQTTQVSYSEPVVTRISVPRYSHSEIDPTTKVDYGGASLSVERRNGTVVGFGSVSGRNSSTFQQVLNEDSEQMFNQPKKYQEPPFFAS